MFRVEIQERISWLFGGYSASGHGSCYSVIHFGFDKSAKDVGFIWPRYSNNPELAKLNS